MFVTGSSRDGLLERGDVQLLHPEQRLHRALVGAFPMNVRLFDLAI
jgi:hypothetical protein